MSIIVSERGFYADLIAALDDLETTFNCVTGPGRSGAIASVYVSHILKIPWIPQGQPIPDKLRPVLIVDTATKTGATLRKAGRRAGEPRHLLAVYPEPPRIRFWYEREARKNETPD